MITSISKNPENAVQINKVKRIINKVWWLY